MGDPKSVTEAAKCVIAAAGEGAAIVADDLSSEWTALACDLSINPPSEPLSSELQSLLYDQLLAQESNNKNPSIAHLGAALLVLSRLNSEFGWCDAGVAFRIAVSYAVQSGDPVLECLVEFIKTHILAVVDAGSECHREIALVVLRAEQLARASVVAVTACEVFLDDSMLEGPEMAASLDYHPLAPWAHRLTSVTGSTTGCDTTVKRLRQLLL